MEDAIEARRCIINNNVWIFRACAQPLDATFCALLHQLLASFAVMFLDGQQHLLEPVHAMLARAFEERVPHVPMFAFMIMFKFCNGVRETCFKQLSDCGGDTSRFETLKEFVSASVLTMMRSHEAPDYSSLMALSSMVGPAIVRHEYDFMAKATQKMLSVVLADAAHVRSIASERTRSSKHAVSEDDYDNLVQKFARAIDINAIATDSAIDSETEATDSDDDYNYLGQKFSHGIDGNSSATNSAFDSDGDATDSDDATANSMYDSDSESYTPGAESPLSSSNSIDIDELKYYTPELASFTK